jgi:anti-sigma regulatory factor (Ser/Thr protein kinase)
MHHPFRHEAMPYSGTAQFVSSSVTMLRDALDRDERPLILAEPERLAHVRDALGPDLEGVTLVPTHEHGRNPSRLLTMMQSFVLGGDDRRTTALLDPALPARVSVARSQEVQLSDAVLNVEALHGWPLSVVCLFDVADLDDAATAEMRRCHAVVRGEVEDNEDFDPAHVRTLYGAALPLPAGGARSLEIAGAHLAEMRQIVHDAALGMNISPDRVDDLVLAVNEIVTNSLRHAGGRAMLRIWADGVSAVCEVTDAGWLEDPLVGRLAPDPARANGRGLWLAHHLCDLVQIRSSPAGTVVRLYVDC